AQHCTEPSTVEQSGAEHSRAEESRAEPDKRKSQLQPCTRTTNTRAQAALPAPTRHTRHGTRAADAPGTHTNTPDTAPGLRTLPAPTHTHQTQHQGRGRSKGNKRAAAGAGGALH